MGEGRVRGFEYRARQNPAGYYAPGFYRAVELNMI